MFEIEKTVNSQVKRILNSSIDTTNIVSFSDWLSLSVQTLKTIISSIEFVYGKNALNHLIIYNDLKSFNVFSNDGIHILKSMEFCSPIQEYITNNIRYIGERVEQAAADGTSTAILAASIILHSIQSSYLNYNEETLNVICEEFQKNLKSDEKDFIEIMDDILSELENYKIDLKDLNDDLYQKMIYSLSYITSKGNEELSKMIVDIYKHRDIPFHEFSGYNYLRSQVENSLDFELVSENADISVNVVENRSAVYNDKLGTAIDHECCDLIVIPDTIDEVRDIELIKELKAYIENSEVPIVLLSNGINTLFQADLMKRFENKTIVFCQYMNYCTDFKINPLELRVILYSNQKKGYGIGNKKLDDSIFKGIYCHIENGKLTAYLEGKESVNKKRENFIRPGYTDPDWFNEYTQLLKAIKFELDNKRNSHVIDIGVRKIIEELTRMYKYMICPYQPILRVGGKSTDHLANLNVVEDVLGSISIALKKGVILDGLMKLCIIASKLGIRRNKMTSYVFDAFIYLYNLTHKFKYELAIDYGSTSDFDPSYLIFRFINGKDENVSKEEREMLEKFSYVDYESETINTPNVKNTKPCLVQSYESFKELFIRLKEVIPRLITTVNVIVPGEVNVKKEEK